jgi:hypothetical protein
VNETIARAFPGIEDMFVGVSGSAGVNAIGVTVLGEE